MFLCRDIKYYFYERIETLYTFFIKILPGFKTHFINTRFKKGILIQQAHHPAIRVGGSQPDLFPFFFVLPV